MRPDYLEDGRDKVDEKARSRLPSWRVRAVHFDSSLDLSARLVFGVGREVGAGAGGLWAFGTWWAGGMRDGVGVGMCRRLRHN